jgi:hypothetical protein
MTRKILSFVFSVVILGAINAQTKVAIYGSLWEQGQESKCNWYFHDDKAVMELIYEVEGKNIRALIGMKSGSNQLFVNTIVEGSANCTSIHIDSIRPGSIENISFVRNGSPKEFDSFGVCQRAQARTHTNEFMMYVFAHPAIQFSKFGDFIKNDPAFQWLSTQSGHDFPVQSFVVKTNGELERSFLANSYTEDFDSAIFGFIGACN